MNRIMIILIIFTVPLSAFADELEAPLVDKSQNEVGAKNVSPLQQNDNDVFRLPGDDGSPLRVVVYDVTAPGLKKEKGELVTAAVISEIRKYRRIIAMDMGEVQAMLNLEEQKQMLGCSEENTSCFAEISGALGADYIVMGSIGKIGEESTMFSLKLVSMENNESVRSHTKTMKGGTGEELMQAVGPAVTDIFREYKPRSGVEIGVSEELVSRWNPPPLKPWLFWTTASVALASWGATGFFIYKRQTSKTDFDTFGDPDESDVRVGPGQEVVDDQNDFDKYNKYFIIGSAVSGTLTAGAVVLFLFTDWQGDIEYKLSPGSSKSDIKISSTIAPAGDLVFSLSW